jgi:hypothetical protein
MGGVVPLSEHEQRQLEQIEQALYREDRRLRRAVRSSDPRVHYRRRLTQAIVGFVIGAGLLAAGVLIKYAWHVGLVAAGFVLALLCLVWTISCWRHLAQIRLGVADPDGTVRPAKRKGTKGRKRPKPPGQTGMMDRLDERWRRRQEGEL